MKQDNLMMTPISNFKKFCYDLNDIVSDKQLQNTIES